MNIYRLRGNTFNLIMLLLCASVWGCKQAATDLGQTLYNLTKNKAYKALDQDSLTAFSQHYFDDHRKELKNPDYIQYVYEKKGFEPFLVKNFISDSAFIDLTAYIDRLPEHGLSSKEYNTEAFNKLVNEVKDKDAISSSTEAYEKIVALEFMAADLLSRYGVTLEYGQVNPQKVFERYYINTKRPDSLAYERILTISDMNSYLDSIQPKSPLYKALQQELHAADEQQPANKKAALLANLERLRWKHEEDSAKRIYVNIPAFELEMIENNKPTGKMRVVVGTGRNLKDSADTLTRNMKDLPHSNETPMLQSLIHSVQVNPVWNIPKSIASKEILVHAQQDRFYLANNDIDVYKGGTKVDDPDGIDWHSYTKDDLPYSFKQRPGGTNSLGLIKFLFENGSSVYLHDTPAKAGFDRSIRASSHGCVRVQEPLKLAHALFGDSDEYQTIEEEMGEENPKANTIKLKPQVQVTLDYMTAALAAEEDLVFYPDIYGLDRVLSSYL